MNPHTPYIVVAYSSAALIMLIVAILPILRGRKFRQNLQARKLAEQNRQSL